MHVDTSRREILVRAGAGLGALTVGTGSAGATEREEYNVGTGSPAAERAARNAADRVERVLDWGDGEKTITGTFPDRAVDSLGNRAGVRYVEENGRMDAIAQTLPWGIDRVDADVAHADGETGGDNTDGEGGADVAIIDTGIDSDHTDLQANLGSGKAYVECQGGPKDCRYAWDDDEGHGTHCAGIADAVDDSEGVVGVSTAATLHAVKVLDNNGSGSYSDVAAGIKYVADQGWDVGSLSLGGGKSGTVEDACEYAHGKGVLLVAAAGNSGPCSDCVSYPAAEPEVIAVSATEEDDSLAGYSSTGPEVELAAPGSNVYSTYVGGGYDTLSGTSMACPHVSGAGGQLMDNGYSNTEARDQLNSTAEDIGLGDNEQGNGLLDVGAAVDTSSDSAPTVSWVTPSDGDTVSGTITVRIDAADSEDSDDSLDVTYSVDGGTSRSTTYDSTSGYYEDSWDTTGVADGDHTLEAAATDSAGNTSTATITVSTDNTDDAPSVSWVTPSDGETVSGTVTVQVDASDDRDGGSDLTVEWQVDDGTWRQTTFDSTSGYYEDSWDTTTVSDADYSLDARATDTSGNTSSEARITVTVSNTSSAPTIDDVTLTDDSNPAWTRYYVDWAVSDADGDLSSVTTEMLDSGGSVLDSDSSSASGSSDSGTHYVESKGNATDIEVTVTDAAGNSTTTTKSI